MTQNGPFDISVLYVEDDVSSREEVLEFLTGKVREICSAENGADGLELFRRHLPDLIVADISMPVMDGIEMAKSIRSCDKEVPIIVTTAHSDSSWLMDAIEAGVNQYVVKPISFEKLLAAIEKNARIIGNRKEIKHYHEEQERLIQELQAALAKVKLLSGFLPICSSCKKIRDDKGYWQQIESYVRNHSEAEFSHGICPDCFKKLYPGMCHDGQ